MRFTMPRAAALAALLASALAIAACGGSTFDQGDLESQLLDGVQQAGVQAESASCPSDVSDEDGTEFSCTITAANGDELTIDGEIEVEGDTATPIFDLSTLKQTGGVSGASGADSE